MGSGMVSWLAIVLVFPLQRQDSNLGCVYGELVGTSGHRVPGNRPPAHLALCVSHRDAVWSLYNKYTISIEQIYNL